MMLIWIKLGLVVLEWMWLKKNQKNQIPGAFKKWTLAGNLEEIAAMKDLYFEVLVNVWRKNQGQHLRRSNQKQSWGGVYVMLQLYFKEGWM